jgi:predicted DNA-binding transcriptional regulator AlpA
MLVSWEVTMDNELVDGKYVSALTKISQRQILRMEKAGMFPGRVRLSHGIVRWSKAEIDAWVRARLDMREAG